MLPTLMGQSRAALIGAGGRGHCLSSGWRYPLTAPALPLRRSVCRPAPNLQPPFQPHSPASPVSPACSLPAPCLLPACSLPPSLPACLPALQCEPVKDINDSLRSVVDVNGAPWEAGVLVAFLVVSRLMVYVALRKKTQR